MPDEINNRMKSKEYDPPKITEKKDLDVELFSDEPDPWGP